MRAGWLAILLIATEPGQEPTYPALLRELNAATSIDAVTRVAAAWQPRVVDMPAGSTIVTGLAELRRFELTGNEQLAEHAAELLSHARDAAPAQSWAHAAYALALARGPDVRSNGPMLRVSGRAWSKELGLDARAKARRAAEHALELDSTNALAALVLGEIALQLRETGHLQAAARALAHVPAGDRDAALEIAQARVLDALGKPADALEHSAAAAATANTAEALHTHALALLRTEGREAEGADVYGAAIEDLTPALAERLFEEVRYIATPADTLRWNAADLAGRKQWLRQMWKIRAAMSAVSVGDRLAEHYRRLPEALMKYPRETDGPGFQTAVVTDKNRTPLDARGQIFLRHGKPDYRIVSASDGSELDGANPGGPPEAGPTIAQGNLPKILLGPAAGACPAIAAQLDNSLAGRGLASGGAIGKVGKPAPDFPPRVESWIYVMPEGARIFTFTRCNRVPDYIIAYDMPCNTELPAVLLAQNPTLKGCSGDTRELLRERSVQALRTETFHPDWDHRIPMVFDLLSFRGADGKTDLLAPVGLGLGSVRAKPVIAGVEYGVQIGLFVVDTAAQRVESTDTTIRVRTDQPLDQSGVLSLHATASVTPTENALLRLRVTNANFRRDGNFIGQQIRVPAYRGDTLMVSDLVLGLESDGGNWQRGGRRISLTPHARFNAGKFKLFYELYNMPQGTQFTTKINVRKMGRFGPQESVVNLSFDDVANPDADGVVRVLQSVETLVGAGRYRMELRTTTADGKTVQKVRDFIVE